MKDLKKSDHTWTEIRISTKKILNHRVPRNPLSCWKATSDKKCRKNCAKNCLIRIIAVFCSQIVSNGFATNRERTVRLVRKNTQDVARRNNYEKNWHRKCESEFVWSHNMPSAHAVWCRLSQKKLLCTKNPFRKKHSIFSVKRAKFRSEKRVAIYYFCTWTFVGFVLSWAVVNPIWQYLLANH